MIDTETHFVARCPHCSAGLRVRRTYVGQQVRCKQCEQVFVAEEGRDEENGVPGEMPALTPATAEVEPRIAVACPSCGATLNVRVSYVGKQVRCKQCDEAFVVADPSAPPPPTADGGPPDDPGRALREELEKIRGELERALADNQHLRSEVDRLRAKRDKVRAERNQLREEGEQLLKAHQGLEAGHQELQEAHARLQESHEGLRVAHDGLAAEAQELRTAHDRKVAENGQLAADRDRLRAEREDLGRMIEEARARVAELDAERDGLLAERDRWENDLDRLVDALGGIAPDDVRPMAEEREALRSEVERLRTEIAASAEQRSAFEGAALERQQRWEADLAAARAEADRHAATLADREAALEAAFAERDRLRDAKGEADAEVARLREAVERLEREYEGRAERNRGEVERHRSEVDRLATLVGDREAALEAALAERDRLRDEAAEAVSEADRLREGVDRLQREHRERLEGDRGEVDRLRSELDHLAGSLRDQAAALEAAIGERDQFAVEKESMKIEIGRLRMSLHQLEREHLDRSEQDRAEVDRLRSEVEMLRVPDRRGAAAAVADPEDELREALSRAAALQRELGEVRRLEAEMRGILAGIGIRFREV